MICYLHILGSGQPYKSDVCLTPHRVVTIPLPVTSTIMGIQSTAFMSLISTECELLDVKQKESCGLLYVACSPNHRFLALVKKTDSWPSDLSLYTRTRKT